MEVGFARSPVARAQWPLARPPASAPPLTVGRADPEPGGAVGGRRGRDAGGLRSGPSAQDLGAAQRRAPQARDGQNPP